MTHTFPGRKPPCYQIRDGALILTRAARGHLFKRRVRNKAQQGHWSIVSVPKLSLMPL